LDRLGWLSINDEEPGQNFALFAAHESPAAAWRPPE
jgi:hypothetical protein